MEKKKNFSSFSYKKGISEFPFVGRRRRSSFMTRNGTARHRKRNRLSDQIASPAKFSAKTNASYIDLNSGERFPTIRRLVALKSSSARKRRLTVKHSGFARNAFGERGCCSRMVFSGGLGGPMSQRRAIMPLS